MKTAAVTSGYLMNGDTPLYFHEWGRSDAPDLFFIGPLRAAAYNWKPIAEQFADRFHCVAVNLRGHCDSGPMLAPNTDVNLYVSDIASAIDQLGLDKPTVVAFAPLMVGAGATFAAKHPDKLRSLVVIDGGPGLRPAMLPNVKKRLADIPATFQTWDDAVKFLRDGLAPPIQSLAEERAPFTFRRTEDGTVIWKYDPLLRDEFMRDDPPPYLGTRPDSVWESIRCPILFMLAQGGLGQLSLTDVERFVKYGEKSQFVEVPDTKHFLMEENPAGFLAALTPFLNRIYSAVA